MGLPPLVPVPPMTVPTLKLGTEEVTLGITVEEVSPEELAAFRARRERYKRNEAWLVANAAEVYRHRACAHRRVKGLYHGEWLAASFRLPCW